MLSLTQVNEIFFPMKLILLFKICILMSSVGFTQEPEKVVQRQLEAYNLRDIDSFMAVFRGISDCRTRRPPWKLTSWAQRKSAFAPAPRSRLRPAPSLNCGSTGWTARIAPARSPRPFRVFPGFPEPRWTCEAPRPGSSGNPDTCPNRCG